MMAASSSAAMTVSVSRNSSSRSSKPYALLQTLCFFHSGRPLHSLSSVCGTAALAAAAVTAPSTNSLPALLLPSQIAPLQRQRQQRQQEWLEQQQPGSWKQLYKQQHQLEKQEHQIRSKEQKRHLQEQQECVLTSCGSAVGNTVPSTVQVSLFLRQQNVQIFAASNSVVDGFVPGAGLWLLQVRWKKKRGKKERLKPTADQLAAKTNIPPTRLEDRITSEPPAAMAQTIRSQISRAAAGWKTKRMFTYRNKYRLRRLVRLTHDVTDEEREETHSSSTATTGGNSSSSNSRRGGPYRRIVGRTFITPLTKLQHQATLPRTPLHTRFDFPHTFSYNVFWGGPQVREEPGHSACWVSFRLRDLGLPERQERRLLSILGEERYDEATGIALLEADIFPQSNHNAAYLGDIFQVLLREAKKA